jgi:hypothetical protein
MKLMTSMAILINSLNVVKRLAPEALTMRDVEAFNFSYELIFSFSDSKLSLSLRLVAWLLPKPKSTLNVL